MLLIPCPWCGPRNQIEFTYGGDATRRAPDAGCAAGRRGTNYVYLRDNPCGPHDELWLHSAGCRRWFEVRRDTRTHDILASARARSGAARRQRVTQSHPPGAAGGIVDRSRTLDFTFDGAALPGPSGRHAGLGAARQRRASGRPQLQVPPAARHRHRRRRGAERAGPARRAARAPSPIRARRSRSSTTVSSRRARTAGRRSRFDIGALNDAVRRRSFPAGFYYKTFMWPPGPRWWLELRACDPPRRRARPRAARARSRPLRASLCALRRAGGRRRAGGPRRGARCRALRRARDAVRRKRDVRRQSARRPRRRSTAHRRASWIDARVGELAANARRHAAAAHDRVRLLRPEPGRPGRARRRSSAGAAAHSRRASGCGTCAPARSCSRPARSSAASPTRTTICPARCSPARRRPMSIATPSGPERAR